MGVLASRPYLPQQIVALPVVIDRGNTIDRGTYNFILPATNLGFSAADDGSPYCISSYFEVVSVDDILRVENCDRSTSDRKLRVRVHLFCDLYTNAQTNVNYIMPKAIYTYQQSVTKCSSSTGAPSNNYYIGTYPNSASNTSTQGMKSRVGLRPDEFNDLSLEYQLGFRHHDFQGNFGDRIYGYEKPIANTYFVDPNFQLALSQNQP